MLEKGRSELFGKIATMIGFGFAEHPLKPKHFLSVVFYKTPEEYVICLSEGPNQGMTLAQRADQQRSGLGEEVPGMLIAPFAQRSLEAKFPLDEFKKIMTEE